MASSTEEQTSRNRKMRPRRDRLPASQRPRAPWSIFRNMARAPGVVALWCVGIGFVLGWKLKLW